MVVVNVGITLFLILEADLGWMGRVYAMLGSNLIFFLISIYILYKHKWFIFKIPNLSILKEVLLFGLPLVPHTLTIWMRQGVDRYIINYCWDLTSVAVFSFAINLSSIIQIIGLAFNASNSVYIYKTLAEKHNDFYHKLFKQIKLMTIFFVVVTIVIYFLSRIGITYFIPKYADSIVLLLPLSLSALFQCVYLLFVNFLFYYGKTKKIMYITVGISVLHVALSLIFSKYSIIYTAYINLLSTFAICCLIILSARKEITKQYI